MILGVTGTNGAGKGEVVKYLEHKGLRHYSVRDEIVAEIERRELQNNRPTMGRIGNELRERYGPGYFIDLFMRRAEEEGVKNMMIESLRSIGEAAKLKAFGGFLLAVDADRHIRYERVVLRNSHTDQVDFDTWVGEEEREWHNEAAHDMNVPGVIKLADYKIENNGSLEELQAQVDVILAKIHG